MNFFANSFSEEEARQSMLYSYKNSINGFAALLSDEEADILSGEQLINIILLSHLRIVQIVGIISFVSGYMNLKLVVLILFFFTDILQI